MFFETYSSTTHNFINVISCGCTPKPSSKNAAKKINSIIGVITLRNPNRGSVCVRCNHNILWLSGSKNKSTCFPGIGDA